MARHDSVSAELARARSVQEFMLPAAPTVPGLEIATSYRACKGLGGDFYDFLVVDPWHLGIVIADVSGHGTAAALVMSAAKTLQIVGRNCHSPRDVLLLANDAIRADLPRGMFVSAWYGILDIRDLSLVFARAGHPPCLLVSDGAVRGQWPEGPGPVLGIMPSSQLGPRLAESRLQLRPGDAMLLHTDGLSEAFAPEGEMYGKTRLHQKLLRAPDVGAEQFITELRADVDRFRADEPPTDDEAMVLVRVLGRMGKPQPLGSGEDAEAPEFLDDLPPLLGRDRDIAELCDLIGGDAALVTITGPGGVGKTRAAQAVAARMKNHFPSGVWFVDLTSARETWAICRAVAGALGVQEGDSALNVRVGNALRGRAASRGGPALLVLDNCEQAAEPVGRLVNEWRARAPGTRFLLTSRVPVNTRGEHIYNLRPLRTPSRRTGRITVNEAVLKALAEIPSVDLFVRRARERSPRFALTAQNAETVCRICEALDGLPLAIELAAARVGVMTPEKILERLGERFEWLRGREDTGHHATLEDLIGWSWDLLEPAERDLLAELSVFHGGFVLETAQQVVQVRDGAGALADMLEGLCAKSLMYREPQPELDDEPRFYLYESVRLYAEQRLNALGRGDETRARWRSALVEYARRWWQRRLSTRALEARARYEAELDGLLRIAREGTPVELAGWAAVIISSTQARTGADPQIEELVARSRNLLPPSLEVGQWLVLAEAESLTRRAPAEAERMVKAVEFAGPIRYFSRILLAKCAMARGDMAETEALTRLALEVPGLTPLQKAAANDRIGLCHYRAGRLDDAIDSFDAALRVALDQKDVLLESTVLAHVGSTHKLKGDFEKSEFFIREAIRLAQSVGAAVSESSWLGNLGVTLAAAGKLQSAEACILRALRLTRETGNPSTEASHLINLAYVYHRQQRAEEALPLLREALRIHTEIGNRHGTALALANIAALERQEGRLDEALARFEQSREAFLRLSDAYAAAGQLAHIGTTLALMYARRPDPALLDRAIETLRRCMAELQQHKFLRDMACEAQLAHCLRLKGETAEARRLAQGVLEAEKRAPNSLPREALDTARATLDAIRAAEPDPFGA